MKESTEEFTPQTENETLLWRRIKELLDINADLTKACNSWAMLRRDHSCWRVEQLNVKLSLRNAEMAADKEQLQQQNDYLKKLCEDVGLTQTLNGFKES